MTGKTKSVSACALGAAIAGVLAFSGPASAATLTWDTNTGLAGAQGGGGTWNTSNGLWLNTGGTNQNWANSNDAVFGAPGGIVSVTGANITVNSLTVNAGATGYEFNEAGNTLRFGAGGIVANESAIIRPLNGNAILTANSTWSVAPGKVVSLASTNNPSTGARIVFQFDATLNGGGRFDFSNAADNIGLSAAIGSTASVTIEIKGGTTVTAEKRLSDGFAINLPANCTYIQNSGTTDLSGSSGTTTDDGTLHTQNTGAAKGIVRVNTGGTIIAQRIDGSGDMFSNGGTLKPSVSGFDFLPNPGNNGVGNPVGLATTFLQAGGVTFDTSGVGAGAVNVAINQPLLEDATSIGGGLSKVGAGTLTLNKVNTYTGDTVVSAGTLELADNAGLKFVIGASGVNNSIEGTGTALLDGDFTFDLVGASTTLGSSWLVVNNATLSETFGGTFSVAGFSPLGLDLWTSPIDANTQYVFSETTGTLAVAAIPEPTSLALLGLTAGALIRRRRSA
jgi:autotransporter-associated beta strand protein